MKLMMMTILFHPKWTGVWFYNAVTFSNFTNAISYTALVVIVINNCLLNSLITMYVIITAQC